MALERSFGGDSEIAFSFLVKGALYRSQGCGFLHLQKDAWRISQFLVHSHKNDCYAKSRPYPQGDERFHYGRLFDELFRSWAAML